MASQDLQDMYHENCPLILGGFMVYYTIHVFVAVNIVGTCKVKFLFLDCTKVLLHTAQVERLGASSISSTAAEYSMFFRT